MKTIYLIGLLFCATIARSQDSTGHNRLYSSVSFQQYYDVNSVKTDGIAPEQSIRSRNTYAHYWGLNYERTTRGGILFGGGISYGLRRYDIGIYQDLTHFDPNATTSLVGREYRRDIRASVKYWGPRVMCGYRLQYGRNWSLSSVVGISVKDFITQVRDVNRTIIMMYVTDSGALVGQQHIGVDYSFGGHRLERDHSLLNLGQGTYSFYRKYVPCYDVYLGVEREYRNMHLRSFAIGLEMTRAMTFKGRWKNRSNSEFAGSDLTANVRDNVMIAEPRNYSHDKFIDRNISLGIRFAVGLWR